MMKALRLKIWSLSWTAGEATGAGGAEVAHVELLGVGGFVAVVGVVEGGDAGEGEGLEETGDSGDLGSVFGGAGDCEVVAGEAGVLVSSRSGP